MRQTLRLLLEVALVAAVVHVHFPVRDLDRALADAKSWPELSIPSPTIVIPRA